MTNTHRPLSSGAWSSALDRDRTVASPMDLSVLGEHLGLCQARHAHLVSVHCAAQSLRGFVATRLMTTAVVLALLLCVGRLAL